MGSSNNITVDVEGKPVLISLKQVWIDKLKAEGEYKEWMERVRYVMNSEGTQYDRASYKVLVEYGYSPGKARDYYKKQIAAERERREMDDREIEAARRNRTGEEAAMLEAYAALPNEAPQLPADVAWVYNHAVMNPAVVLTKKDGKPVIRAQDIAGAPSKGAVGMLIHYAEHKTEFYKLVLSHFSRKDVKAEAELGGKEVESEDDLSELDAMLRAAVR